MEVLSVKNLEFQYESDDTFSLKGIDMEIQRGEMVLFCGPCGCGKTTFFRLLKEELRPAGRLNGSICNVYGSSATAYLFQNPDSQIVCETVEEELVFGAENLGMPREEMARAVAELSAYLGIEELLHVKTAQLSGGQKQMINLASLLLMKPKLLLLDEPVSQLDPVSTCEFIQLLRKLREELDMTILIIEHNLDAFLKEVDRVVYMQEGTVAYNGNAHGLLDLLQKDTTGFACSMPETVKVYLQQRGRSAAAGQEAFACGNIPVANAVRCYPLTVKELLQMADIKNLTYDVNSQTGQLQRDNTDGSATEPALVIKKGYFRYEKHAPDILKNLNLSLEKGKIYALTGGNGTGKSTLLSVLSGYRKLYRGTCRINGNIGILPQNPVYAFFQDVLEEDFKMVATEEEIQKVLGAYKFCSGIRGFLHKNPLDLSGGQMQKAAIVKMLLGNAEILLMDEPVKAMDGYEKKLFAALLQELKRAGRTILFVSHDLEFAETAADEALMMFDGRMIARDIPQVMFQDNRFYTTVRGRIRGIMKDE